MNIPNSLTILRILLIPVYIGCMTYGEYGLALVALLLAGLTDAVDGLIARKWNQQTRLGMFLDPLADKLLLTSGFLSLAWLHLIPSWLVILVVSRDVILLLGTAVAHLTATRLDVTPTMWGKGTTALQLSYLFLAVLLTWLGKSLSILTPLMAVMVAFTVISGFQYLQRGYRNSNLPSLPR
ncbi:CDP-alcohol phosphatidyltransferase family protein [Candidatus Nitrospira inopinata]|jgi:cardiolipin synthase|uniref:CDP-diacylglycerol--glycerol-3-phosphate 3-phosphatidyltransferase n=1 Tax=Candidatus Nitrospira inopinata TaxID=1715989 RepID=A0A0S4KQ24_9BACT|nr:CDP-alcohol phosphatidyltransferase family protein [Candidatus Nitrospira inopinata]CUQ65258.1 CDP-diacylglycerol-glycerol-3-phosphate 3-phosphatidyltransferase [Candidatus Nitrospira inopinata]